MSYYSQCKLAAQTVGENLEFDGNELLLKTHGEGHNTLGLEYWAYTLADVGIFAVNSAFIESKINSRVICVPGQTTKSNGFFSHQRS